MCVRYVLSPRLWGFEKDVMCLTIDEEKGGKIARLSRNGTHTATMLLGSGLQKADKGEETHTIRQGRQRLGERGKGFGGFELF